MTQQSPFTYIMLTHFLHSEMEKCKIAIIII